MKKIGIIGAMEQEVDTLKSRMADVKITAKAGMEFYEGRLNGTDTVVVRCGIGKVHAAMCVQALCDLFSVTHIVNTGIAGSLDEKLDIGDILVSVDAVQHDFDVTVFGYAKGQVAGTELREFVADPCMVQCALDACAGLTPSVNAKAGRVVSGDQFICDKAVKDALVAEYEAQCTEMEGAAIAQAAWRNGVPFVILRAISDKADGSAEMDYPTFERMAAEVSARLAEALCGRI